MKLTGKKFLLILLYSPINGNKYNTPITGRTRLMKMVFLFKEEILPEFKKDVSFDEINIPEYFPWNYGPFSKDLLNDLEFLINQEYIKSETSKYTPIEAELDEYEFWVNDMDDFREREYEEETFKLTEEKGIPKALEIWQLLTENQQQILIEFKKLLQSAPLDRILEYVYKKYQEKGYIDKSLIRDRYLS